MVNRRELYKNCWLDVGFDDEENPIRVRLDGEPSEQELNVIGQSPTLKELWLFDREMSDEDLEKIVNLKLKNIEHCWVRSPKLTAKGISLFRKWKKLKTVSFDDYSSLEHVDELSTVKSLRKLSLSDSRNLDDHCLKSISKMSALTELRIGGYGHKITPAGIKRLGSLTKLQVLSLREIKLDEVCFKTIAKLKNLKELWVCDCSIKPEFFQHFGGAKGLTKLRKINLISAKGVSDKIFPMLAKLPALEEIDLQYSKTIRGKGIESLANCRKLKRLKFHGAKKLDTKNFAGFADIASLEHLQISSTRLKDDLCFELAKMKKLKQLDLSYSDITSKGLEQIVDLPKLEKLDVEGIQLKPSTLRQLVDLPKIQKLNITDCGIKKPLRKELEQKKSGLFQDDEN